MQQTFPGNPPAKSGREARKKPSDLHSLSSQYSIPKSHLHSHSRLLWSVLTLHPIPRALSRFWWRSCCLPTVDPLSHHPYWNLFPFLSVHSQYLEIHFAWKLQWPHQQKARKKNSCQSANSHHILLRIRVGNRS